MGTGSSRRAASVLRAFGEAVVLIHLDTSFLIRSLSVGSSESQAIEGWLKDGMVIEMSAPAWTEFLCGPLGTDDVDFAERFVAQVEPYLVDDASVAARLYNESGRRRGSLLDCMVAAIALRVEATLATSNPDDFRRFESDGLEIFVP